MSAHIVGLEQPSLFLNHINGLGMILHIEPVPHVLSVPVNGKLLSLQRIVDHQRNKLFRKLIRSVIVGAVGDVCRESVGIHIGLHQHVRAGLAGRVRAVWRIGRGLIEIAAVLLEGAVYLVRGHMKKSLVLLIASVRILPGSSRTVEHDSRSQNIGLHEHLGIFDASVHMALRRKMNHPVNIILRKNPGNGILITDIRSDKGVVLSLLHFLQILQIPRIGQRIHVDNADLVIILLKHVMNIVGTDKPGPAGH